MSEYVPIAQAGDLQDGQMKKVNVGGLELLLARVDGSYYAIDDRCPHMGGDLSKGSLRGSVVTCPRHGSRFDVQTGQLVRWTEWSGVKLTFAKMFKSPRSTTAYEVKRDGDTILVDVASRPSAQKAA